MQRTELKTGLAGLLLLTGPIGWLAACSVISAPAEGATPASAGAQPPPHANTIFIEVPEARGPAAPDCRVGSGPRPGASGPSRGEASAPVAALVPSELPAGDPATSPIQPVEGPPEVLDRIRDLFVRGDGGERIRLSFFGDSHTSADWWTGHIRRVLQDRWGDLGHGFVMPAAIYRGYRGQDVNLCSTGGWRSDWTGRLGGRDDGLLGFAGMSVSSASRNDFGWMQTTVENPHGRRVARFRVYALGQPGGGALRVGVDGADVRTVSTAAVRPTLQEMRISVPDGPHRLTVAPAGDGEVRLFGVSMERAGPGALVDAMGIRGRRARDWLSWDPALVSAGLASLGPDLVVLAYGTNEAFDTDYSMGEYRGDLEAVLARLQTMSPDAAPCLLVGPPDLASRTPRGWAGWPRAAEIARIQREVAREFGCAFWDWQAATGGPGSMVSWAHRRPPLAAPDGIHHTRAGYELVAEKFLSALEGGPGR